MNDEDLKKVEGILSDVFGVDATHITDVNVQHDSGLKTTVVDARLILKTEQYEKIQKVFNVTLPYRNAEIEVKFSFGEYSSIGRTNPRKVY